MQLPVRGHPLHTRSLTLVVSALASGRWHARGDVIDLRKVGFVPMVSDIQPAGIIHQMSIELEVDPQAARVESVKVEQPFVAIEPSASSRGECCRDPAPRLQAMAGQRLDGEFARRLTDVFGGPRGCSHLLTLFQLMSSGLQRAFALEAALRAEAGASRPGPGARGAETSALRQPGDRLFRRSAFVEGFEGEDGSIEMAVQLADFHTRNLPPDAPPTQRLAGQWDARLFARATGPERRLTDLRAADRARNAETLATAEWRDHTERLAPLEGVTIVAGLARRLFAIFGAPEDRLLLDAGLQLAPGYIQVMAAVMDRLIAQLRQGSSGNAPPRAPGSSTMVEVGNVGGMPDSCYMWRSDGPMVSLRSLRGGPREDEA